MRPPAPETIVQEGHVTWGLDISDLFAVIWRGDFQVLYVASLVHLVKRGRALAIFFEGYPRFTFFLVTDF